MSLQHTPRPRWLTFDCYGTLIQWDEGLRAAVREILETKRGSDIDPAQVIAVYDRHEHALEQTPPHRSFREVAGVGLRLALAELGLAGDERDESDARILTDRISAMPPFPEVVDTLRRLKQDGYRLCIVSNTDDDVIAGNVAQLGGYIDRVVTAQQAGAYKPARQLFDYAHRELGVTPEEVVHICASPHLDHAAARDIGFRCVWIDRATGRTLLPDYTPDATLSTLDQVPTLFATLGW
ncbi:haloacid dehalogenase type II [Paraburkholderia rhynchosiae]|uniref:(S)-2-haloacid dehalogenase n=1 Tax=Paraburkholderia rhynchosiae TaxID=487049 RepID=A0A2N7WSE5_9BURK|nr:haloacid dehalogenase type II [Paraburkholderia rhynchosiae]PMS32327.1 haloacid dehalogenase type II [Paraburkholderia rhynchosiae]CAB3731921.1 (S)-2-haloacid dehalogenase [Paraburkholderia rhynchosiae]